MQKTKNISLHGFRETYIWFLTLGKNMRPANVPKIVSECNLIASSIKTTI